MPCVRIVAGDGGLGYELADAGASAHEALPVSEALRDRLSAWNARFEDGCDAEAYSDPTCSRFDFIAFANDGFRLAKEVKRQLPGWTVLYWDEALDWRYWMTRSRGASSAARWSTRLPGTSPLPATTNRSRKARSSWHRGSPAIAGDGDDDGAAQGGGQRSNDDREANFGFVVVVRPCQAADE